MNNAPPSRPPFFQRSINRINGLYLLLILIYLPVRLIVRDRIWQISLLNSFAIVLFCPLPLLLFAAVVVRSRRAVLSLMPIVALLVIWFGPRFLPKITTAPTPPVLRVMTNNIYHLNTTPEKVTEMIAEAKPDVIFLQEVESNIQEQTLNVLKDDYPYESSQLDLIRASHYSAVNLLRSRYPFVISEKIELGQTRLPYIFRNVIEVNGQRIALYNIHLVAPVGGRALPQKLVDNYFTRIFFRFDDSERNRQIGALLAHLATEPYPYIAAGDFNTSDLSMTYNTLSGQMYDSFIEAGVGLGTTWPAVEALGWPSVIPALIRMDYIWHSDGITPVKVWQGGYDGSDHLPLFADFALG